jgi:RNA polymerase sigma-70 factor (ECF subfamily)
MTKQTTNKSLDTALRELVMQARQGDQGAYKKLLTELAPLIRRTVGARIGRWGQQHYAEDITQDTLLAIHLKLHTYDADLPFLAWVNAVARHKLIDTLRRIKGVNISIDDENMPELIDNGNPEAPGIALDLEKLLRQLKPPAGELIYALKVEGVSVRELATAHKLSETNVKVIVHRGLQRLSQLVRAGEA